MGALRDRLDAFKRETVRITSPNMPGRANGGYDALSGTGAPVRYIGPLPQPSQPFNVDYTLQRWFQQIRQERGHMHVMLHRMAIEVPEMTAIYLRMRELGYRLRGEAMTEINRDFQLEQTADPHQPNYWYSNRRLIYKVCELHGIAIADMSPVERIQATTFGDGQSSIYAYLQVFETPQPPTLIVDKDPMGIGMHRAHTDAKSIHIWTWYAACCLSKYLYDEALYSGRGATIEVIAPFDPKRHAAFFPLAHSFAKGLLLLEKLCPAKWFCGCNRIESLLVQRPEAHPWPTGELPSDVLRTMYAEQGGYGEAAPPSRGMTPPAGTYLHEYNRHKTDPNLRNPNEQ